MSMYSEAILIYSHYSIRANYLRWEVADIRVLITIVSINPNRKSWLVLEFVKRALTVEMRGLSFWRTRRWLKQDYCTHFLRCRKFIAKKSLYCLDETTVSRASYYDILISRRMIDHGVNACSARMSVYLAG
ncbi:hypothetical protein DBV15_01941 [Temnothorax longispinosus]|uniref:Uncharacterized protein n=1 Tax=Temnothorax longispinosus TaxID=300112 RepID=A0A4S2KXF4_9HYME|nr:hypothetical protein DBV15_01941 [Temnothorax longispinosus]